MILQCWQDSVGMPYLLYELSVGQELLSGLLPWCLIPRLRWAGQGLPSTGPLHSASVGLPTACWRFCGGWLQPECSAKTIRLPSGLGLEILEPYRHRILLIKAVTEPAKIPGEEKQTPLPEEDFVAAIFGSVIDLTLFSLS